MTNSSPTTTISTVAECLRLLGYRAGEPPWARSGAAIDRDVCRDAECRVCGRVGLDFRPFHRPPRSYRAYAACPECGHAEEV